jgi:hypothetical protein
MHLTRNSSSNRVISVPMSMRMQAASGDKQSNNFADELAQLDSPRTDTPKELVAAKIPPMLGAMAAKVPPIDGSREALLMFVDQLPEHVPDTSKKAGRAALRGAQALRGAKAKAQLSAARSVAMAEEKL